MVTTSISTTNSMTISDKSTANPSTSTKDIYYNVMTADYEDIISISHDDIVSNKCDVTLEKLSDQDIKDIQVYLRGNQKLQDDTEEIKLPKHLKEQKRRVSHRPGRKPSKERI